MAQQPTVPTFKVWNQATQRAEDLPFEQAREQIFNPQSSVGLIPGQKYHFKDESGSIFEASNPDDVFKNLQNGLTPISQAHADAAVRAAQYDNTLGQVGTAVAGGLRGATFGLSDAVATGVGSLVGKKEEVQNTLNALREANPLTDTVSNVAGAIGSSLIPVATPVKAVTALGRLAEGAVATEKIASALSAPIRALGSSGVLGVTARALEQGVKLGFGSSVEGALYGAGNVISEQALGDPRDLGESIISNIGLGTLLGGATGGALGVASQLAQPVAQGLGKAFVTISGKTKGLTDEEIAATRKIFEPGTEANAYITDAKKFNNEVNTQLEKIVNDVSANSQAGSQELNRLIGQVKADPKLGQEAIDSLVNNIDSKLQLAQFDSTAIPSVAVKRLEQIKEQLTPLSPTQLAQVETQIQNASSALATASPAQKVALEARIEDLQRIAARGSPENAFQILRNAKRAVGDYARFGLAASPEEKISQDIFKKLYSDVDVVLKDETLFGQNAQLLAAFDEAHYNRFKIVQKLKDEGVFKKLNKNDKSIQISGNGFSKLLKDENNATLIEDLIRADLDMSGARALLSGTPDTATGIQTKLPEMIRARRSLEPLFRNESSTGKSLAAGAIGFGIGGPKLAALFTALDNPGWVTTRLAQAYNTAGKLPGLLSNDAMSAVTQSILNQVNQSTSDRATRFMQMRDAEKSQQKVTQLIQSSFSDAMANAAQSRGVQDKKPMKILSEKDFENLHTNLQMSDQDLAKRIQQGFSQMPQTAQSAAQTAVKAKNFLSSKMPPLVQDELGIEKAFPTKQALVQYSRYVDAVNNPLDVLKDLSKGYVNREGLETLRVVYPAIWAAVQAQVKTNLKGTPSPKQRQLLAQIVNGGSQNLTELGITAQKVWSGANQSQAQQEQGGVPSVSQPRGQKFKVDIAAAQEPNRRGSAV